MAGYNKNGYAFSRQWFEFVFETEENITPIHTALYSWIVELNNKLQWCPVFGLPTDHSMKAIGLKTYRPYINALNDLIRWGFIELRAKSYNQHTSNQIALVLKAKAQTKAEPKQPDLLHTLRPKQSRHNKTVKTIKKNNINSEGDFSLFWEDYHSKTGMPKTDREAALKHWKKLTHSDQQKAIDNIQPFFNSLRDKQFCKKARTYLSDKNYNDEFKVLTTPKLIMP